MDFLVRIVRFIDDATGFCVTDALSLIGEVELHTGETTVIEENPID
ncbi:hypothetical protein [Sphingobium limneticum]|nr:hypothetical protein [Sphingobium limneticum]